MIATAIIGCTIAVLLILVWYLAKTSTAGADALQVWGSQGQSVNVDAFRLLVNPDETAYLWKSVPEAEFRRLQRKRIALALRSVRMMASNAGLLMGVATQARHTNTDDSEIAAAAERLMLLSFQVRINALVVEVYLLLKWIFPAWAMSIPVAIERYERLLQNCDWILAQGQQVPAYSRLAR
jgi:hypothetical protein